VGGGGEKDVIRCLEEEVRVDEAADGALDRCEKDDKRGFPGRPPEGGVSLGVGSVARNKGTDLGTVEYNADRSESAVSWGYIQIELSGAARAIRLDGPASDWISHDAMCVGSKSNSSLEIRLLSIKNGTRRGACRMLGRLIDSIGLDKVEV
jgi:hypothetical protein